MIETGDLDPIYVMLVGAELEPDLLARWCLAYWMFYHAGTASRIAVSPDFWATARTADVSRWPRGAERRHFRGAASARSIARLSARFPDPARAVESLRSADFGTLTARVRAWPMFGPWVAFKVADMAERVLGWPVDFSGCELSLYAEPRSGASQVARKVGLPDNVPVVLAWLADRLGDLLAPPGRDRRLGVQEFETILCKFKAHVAGRYPVGKDTREIRHSLAASGPLAATLAAHLPEVV